jgi:hypothetical protein
MLAAVGQAETMRPHIFVTAEPVPGLRSVAEVREAIQSGHAAALWDALVAKVDREALEEAWTPHSMVKGRSAAHAAKGNRDFVIVAMSANRVTDAALVALIRDDRRYADAAMKQIDALFDPERWPDWEDMAHINAGRRADLRHGQLVVAVAVAYDWLYELLSAEERQRILAGIDRCALAPYKAGVEAKESWLNNNTNWMTVMVGGFGIAGMALGADHPESGWMVALAEPRMASYLDVLGQEGEFNESVQYAGSMMNVVRYFMAQQYASGGTDKPFERHALDRFCRWYMHMTFPPGRVAGFGDPAPDMPPVVSYFSAVASATQDPVLQWFYLQYADRMLVTHRRRAFELLYYDANLQPQPPGADFPLGRAYHGQGKLVSSRSSWDPASAVSVVYGKAGREASHSHADWGQVCIDGYGERLLVDLGSPPGYPKSEPERYYNYQQWGHNVFVLGENDTGGVSWRERRLEGTIPHAEFDRARGGAWIMDLTPVYSGATTVTRTVVHLLPRVAVVLDRARLETPQPISMRWHTIAAAEPDAEGRFTVHGKQAALLGYTTRLDGPAELRTGRHAYAAPYDKDRLGTPYPAVNEPFVEITTRDDRCTLLSIFCTLEPDDVARSEILRTDGGWTVRTPEGNVDIRLDENELAVAAADGRRWEVTLP